MQGLKYAFRFNTASFSLAFSNPGLIKSWLLLGLGHLALTFAWIVLLSLLVGLLGLSPISIFLMGMFFIFLIFDLMLWGNTSMIGTSRHLAGIYSKAPSQTADWKSNFFDGWGSAALWFLAKPGLHLIDAVQSVFPGIAGTQREWLIADYLMLPVISVENLSLMQAVGRVSEIVKANLVRVRASIINVRLFAGMVQWILTASGIGVGWLVFLRIVDPVTSGRGRTVLGLAAAVLLACVLTSLGILISSFTRACYHTALYQWVRNVENARHSGDREQALPPAILVQVLERISNGKKE